MRLASILLACLLCSAAESGSTAERLGNARQVTDTLPPPSLRVSIPSIGFDRDAVLGGLPELNAGQLVVFTKEANPRYSELWRLMPLCPWPVMDGCRVWVAAHRTTYGAVFNRLPEVQVGDSLMLGNVAARVVYREVCPADCFGYSFQPYPIILQTSMPNGRLIVYAKPTN